MINICVPVLKRYDLLARLLESLERGTLRPDFVYVIDNGRSPERLQGYMTLPIVIHVPDRPLGLAESWNWFIRNVPEDRIICNDDITFGENDLQRMIETEGAFVSALAGSNACSCFLLRDSCVERVGLFDESISPGYAYFEDCDYVERMIMAGIPITSVSCGVIHIGSQTIAAYSIQETEDHHAKFLRAQTNFVRKWGRLPSVPGPHWPRPAEVG